MGDGDKGGMEKRQGRGKGREGSKGRKRGEAYGFIPPVLFPHGGRKGRAAFVEGEGVEGVLDAVAQAGVVKGVFFHAFGLDP